jgi:hypothetical protein
MIFVLETAEKRLPEVSPTGVHNWISTRLTEPHPIQLAVAPEDTPYEYFWLGTGHREGNHYRIGYSPDSEMFRIVTALESGVEWYLGNYGTCIEAVDAV